MESKYKPSENLKDKIGQLIRFKEAFLKSSNFSIDVWLARNPEFNEIGKHAIIESILHYEKQSKFRELSNIPEQDWYSYFFNELINGVFECGEINKIVAGKGIRIISFNYDRSLEYFLNESFLFTFQGLSQLSNFFLPIEIHHVYGQIEELKYQTTNNKPLHYGNIHRNNSFDLIKNIKVIHEERVRDKKEELKNWIINSRKIYFLGFGYSPENLKAIGYDEIDIAHFQNKKIYGTVFGLENGEIEEVKKRLRIDLIRSSFYLQLRDSDITFNQNISFDKVDCLTLLRNYLYR